MKILKLSKVVAGALLSASILPFSVNADIHFSGFASIVGGKTLSDDESLYGFDDNINFKQDSIIALQASSDLEEGLGVTVQLTAKGRDEWAPKFKWAFMSFDATDNLRLLAGRQVLPFYMYSDYLDVSYAYPWISPPRGVYDSIFDTFDGLGAVYNTNFGDVDATFHGIYGRNTDEISAFGLKVTPEVNDMAGLAATVTYDWLTLRAAYFSAEVSLPFEDLTALSEGWRSTPFENSAELAENSLISEDTGTFLEVGFQVNLDEIIVVGEYTKLEIDDTPLAEEASYFIMAGYQFDTVLVHLTLGADEGTSDYYTSGVSTAGFADLGVPAGDIAAIEGLKAATEGFIAGQNTEDSYITLGARYDFHDSAALKFEYTNYTDDNNSDNDAGIFRAALVTVF